MKLQSANIPEFSPKEAALPDAQFLNLRPNFDLYKRTWREFGHFKNILIIGHGGSILSFKGIYSVLGKYNPDGHQNPNQKHVHFLSTTDPDYIYDLKHHLKKEDTLVLAISKSGQTITQIEALLQFIDYPLLIITDEESTLGQIAKKRKAKIIPHSDVGGRFSAFAEPGMIPAAICGIDVEALYSGATEFYKEYKNTNNPAYKAAQILYALEERGVVDVFLPFYSTALFGFAEMVIQLCHESFGKEGKGQTYFAEEGPESQHDTNQRLFGGKKNIAVFFQYAEHFRQNLITQVPTDLHSVTLKDENLFTLNKMPLAYSMQSEFHATFTDAKIQSIPALALDINLKDAAEIGRLIAFWQLFAVYSAALRGVDPFTQPAVESSKNISWSQRKNFKFQ